MTEAAGRFAGRVDAAARAADGRLFLAQGDGFDAEALFAAPFQGDARLARLWRPGLLRRKRLCAEVGAALVVLIAPEAHGVHADALPEPLAYATPSVGDRFAALCRSLGIATVWPREALIAARGPVDLYRRDDSHWTGVGAYLAYRALMQSLPPALRRGAPDPRRVAFGWCEGLGDLAAAAGGASPRGLGLASTVTPPRARVVLERRNERRHGLRITEIDDPSLPTAVVFRDSFGGELAPFLSESFRRCVLVGAAERAPLELIAEERPDVVIVERAERAILNGVIDWDLETWRESFPAPDPDGEAYAAELQARALFAKGDAAGALALVEPLRPTIERLILIGRARLALGRTGEAAAALEAALNRAPERWASLLHLGCARLADGEAERARDLFGRACAVAPWHPAGFEHYGFASLSAGEPAAAVAALRTAVRLGPEIAGAHLWLGEALTALGRPEEAAQAYAAGRRACPDDRLLQARAQAPVRPPPEEPPAAPPQAA